ncbi:MAG: response regulator transcription factor [Thiothrix sp.]|nr:MAG: response regulator transcription factor [Thiothrix sp.]
MKAGKLIYVIDDEADICKLVANELARYGHQPQTFRTGGQALYALKKQQPDICIIDLGLPDMDGLMLVKQLMHNNSMGIIILSGRDSLTDKVLGLELGADDYISKPFDPRELVARTNSILRRLDKMAAVLNESPQAQQARFDHWTFYVSTLRLSHENGRCEILSAAEAGLLMALLRAPGQILSRDQLMQERDTAFDRCIDVRMSRIRKKLEADPKNPRIIKTVYGIGYMLTTDVVWHSA